MIGKNRNVLRMSVLSEYGQPVPVIFFGDVETLFAYFTEKFGQEEVENALHGRKTGFYFLWCIQQRLIFIREMKSAAGDEILSLIPLKKRERNCKINAMEGK